MSQTMPCLYCILYTPIVCPMKSDGLSVHPAIFNRPSRQSIGGPLESIRFQGKTWYNTMLTFGVSKTTRMFTSMIDGKGFVLNQLLQCSDGHQILNMYKMSQANCYKEFYKAI